MLLKGRNPPTVRRRNQFADHGKSQLKHCQTINGTRELLSQKTFAFLLYFPLSSPFLFLSVFSVLFSSLSSSLFFLSVLQYFFLSLFTSFFSISSSILFYFLFISFFSISYSVFFPLSFCLKWIQNSRT